MRHFYDDSYFFNKKVFILINIFSCSLLFNVKVIKVIVGNSYLERCCVFKFVICPHNCLKQYERFHDFVIHYWGLKKVNILIVESLSSVLHFFIDCHIQYFFFPHSIQFSFFRLEIKLEQSLSYVFSLTFICKMYLFNHFLNLISIYSQ